MSGKGKSERKPKKGQGKDSFSIGGYKVSYDVLIAILMAAFYALSILAAWLQGGLSAVAISAIVFFAFVAFAYFMKAGAIPKLRPLRSLTLVFLGLSILSLAWQFLLFFNVLGKMGPLAWAVAVGVINAVLSLAIIAGILYLEKISLKDMYVQPGDRLNIAMGIVGFVLCIIVAILASYFIFGGNAIGLDRFGLAIAAVLAFGILGGVFEELLFRGLLLGRAVPILGESNGNIYQAIVFGAFEAVMFYMITSMAFNVVFIILISFITGFYWGRSTLRTKSLWSPMLIHAGFYVLILLPMLVGS